jgi:hypothetical protein
MADSMKRPPMQKQAERLAAQGRYGDSMLVHMSPAEVQGIASLVPGGQLPTNPQTGQPEAFDFLKAVGALWGAIKGRKDAKKASKRAQKQTAAIQARQQPFDVFTAQALNTAMASDALRPGQTLADLGGKASFLPAGTSAGMNMGYQGMPGVMYANRQSIGPFSRQETPPQVAPQPIMESPAVADGGSSVDQLEIINSRRRAQGLPEFESIEDYFDFVSTTDDDDFYGGFPIMAADGGIASLPHFAGGNMVENFPRVGGQISGPGTERSDDIPAMLSDGEFVVNAKGLRGLGKINGANGSKADQRREGARTMYALQRAGEQALRRA